MGAMDELAAAAEVGRRFAEAQEASSALPGVTDGLTELVRRRRVLMSDRDGEIGEIGPCEATDFVPTEDDADLVVCARPGRLIEEHDSVGLNRPYGVRRRFVCPKHGLASALVHLDRCIVHDDCRQNGELAKKCHQEWLQTICGLGESG